VTPFVAEPRWKRFLWRLWRRGVYCYLPGNDRHGLPRRGYRWIVPPREWSQDYADTAISRGRELARRYDW
jgi:hypothetical protein